MMLCTSALLPALAALLAGIACFDDLSSLGSTLPNALISADAPGLQEKPMDGSSYGSDQTCLRSNCHGPFQKLFSGKAAFTSKEGKTINPHVYVPHDMREDVNIPRCLSCHTAHPVPLGSNEAVEKASVDSCYDECHHMKNFVLCKECHKPPECGSRAVRDIRRRSISRDLQPNSETGLVADSRLQAEAVWRNGSPGLRIHERNQTIPNRFYTEEAP